MEKEDISGPGSTDAKYLAVLFLLVLLLFFPNLILQKPALDLPEVSDLAYQWHPWAMFFRESYLSRHFPLWNPYDMAGMPFLAFANSGSLYPLGFLYLLPFPLATSLSVLLHTLLAAGFAYWFFRAIRLGPAVSFIAALSFSMSGEFFRQLSFVTSLQTQAWVPLIFLAATKLTTERRLKWLPVFVFSLAMSLLAGDSELMVYVLAFLVWWLLVLPSARKAASWALLLAGLALCFLLVAAQFFPLAELFHNSLRGASSFHPVYKMPFREPLVFVAFSVFSLFLPIAGGSHAASPSYYPFYFGLLIFLGFWLGLFNKKDRAALRLSCFLVLALIYIVVFNMPALRGIFPLIPVLGKLLTVPKLVTAINFCFLIIAAKGLEAFLQKKFPRAENGAIYLLPIYGILTLASCLLLKSVRLSQPQAAIIARILLGVVLLAFPLWKRVSNPAAWLILISVLDIFGLAIFYFPRSSYDRYRLHPAFAKTLANTEMKGRYAVFSPFLFSDVDLPYSGGIIIKAQGIDSWMRAPVWNYIRLLSLAFPGIFPMEGNRIINYDRFKMRDPTQLSLARLDYLDLLNLRWIVSRFSLPWLEKSGRFRLAGSRGLNIYENLSPLGRAMVFHRIIKTDSDQEAFNLISEKAFDFRTQLLLMSSTAKDLPLSQALAPDEISLARESADQLAVSFETGEPGYLFLDETYFPGWLAELDGKPARIWRANYAFRAVYIDSGKHIVRFFYRPFSFRIGLWCSMASIISFILLAFSLATQKRRL